jgi:hypothetical protein
MPFGSGTCRPANEPQRLLLKGSQPMQPEQLSHGFGIMRDAQTTKPQSFRTEDGWFAYDLAVNLAQM